MLIHDLRYAVRGLRAQPGFAAAVILTFALGLGVNAMMFSLVDATLIRSLPFADADRLVMLYRTARRDDGRVDRTRWSYRGFALARERATSFTDMAAFTRASFNVGTTDDVELVEGGVVSAGYFRLLGVPALVGRTFTAEEDASLGTHPVAIMGHGFWTRRFGADPRVVGSSVRVNGKPLTVVGVMPPGFGGLGGRGDLWVPQMMAPSLTYEDYLTTPQNFMNIVARVRPELTLDRVRAEMAAIGREVGASVEQDDDRRTGWSATLTPLADARRDSQRQQAVLMLTGAVAFVLAIACVNIAALFLARSGARRREIAVRRALGADRPTLVRQLLTESTLLALIGGALGVLLAVWGVEALSRLAPPPVATPRNDWGQLSDFATLRVDARVVAFTFLLSLVTGVLVGLAPALGSTRTDLTKDLKATGPAFVRGRQHRQRLTGRGLLVTSEIALALVLLVGASLLIGSLASLRATPMGFSSEGVVTFWVNAPASRYRPANGPALVERMLTGIVNTPGVRSATVSRCTPYMSNCSRGLLIREGQIVDRRGAETTVGRHYVGPAHFQTLGIPLLRGRTFTDGDRAGRPHVAVVNETAARRLWPGEDAIGKRFWFAAAGDSLPADEAWTVVGIAGDVKYWPIEEPVGIDIYTSYLQFTYPETMVMVRSDLPLSSLLPRIRAAVRAVDADLPVYDVKTIAERAGVATSLTRFNAAVLASFAGLALLLATIGVYGVMAYSVARRTREMGVRLALGATRSDVVRLVTGEGMALALAGIGLGIIAAVPLAGTLRALLYGVSPTAPLLYLGLAVVMALVTLGACAVPALRAGRTDPLVALRAD